MPRTAHPVSDCRVLAALLCIPPARLGDLYRAALGRLMDAASRTPTRRHRAACEAVGIDPGVVGSLAFDKLEDLAGLFWLAAGRSGNARDIHSRLSYLEARDFIRVVWRRRGRERPGVVFVSRAAILAVSEKALAGELAAPLPWALRGPGYDEAGAPVDQEMQIEIDLEGLNPLDVGEGAEAGESRDRAVIDHRVIDHPVIPRHLYRDCMSQSPPKRGSGSCQTGGSQRQLSELRTLLDQHAEQPLDWGGPAGRRLDAMVAEHGLDACLTAIRQRSARSTPLWSPLGWLDAVVRNVEAPPDRVELAVLRCLPRRGTAWAVTRLAPKMREQLDALVEVHGADAVLALLDRGVAAGNDWPVRVLASKLEQIAAAGAAADAAIAESAAAEAKPRAPRRGRGARGGELAVGRHVEAPAPMAHAASAPRPDGAAAALWAAKRAALPPDPALDALVAVAVVAGEVVVDCESAAARLLVALDHGEALAAVGVRIAGDEEAVAA